ncbi:MAG: hypothetical protein B0D92_06855 [Spirochaeta sp. LUC14_002_19_P3]|nr:MAG: hypothetical protein B0D92_06855 [Spirochaeta sp. LUC14_002_19_P3]
MSSPQTFYCIALLAPQSVNIPVLRLKALYAAQGPIPAPLDTIIPLHCTNTQPPPPVPGLLPRCDTPIQLSSALHRSGNWIIQQAEPQEWFAELKSFFTTDTVSRLPENLFPLGEGIPLAVSESASPLLSDIEVPSWRALQLICYEISYSARHPWYLSLYWRLLWRRRLRQAPRTFQDN